ncbi:MAG: sulfate/molybdate ABC transporter ATP-binding protein [Kineosporiaceae bacterium]
MSIVATGVSKRFGQVTALDDVSIDVPEQSLTALLGPSGGGKSTLLRVLAGLESPDAGEVRIAGTDVTRSHPRDRGIGFVFQHYAAFTNMTVAQNIAFGLSVRRRPKQEIRARVAELIDLVQLQGLAARYPDQLSGGQRQRMVLARALAVEPRVLLLDEPFGALDAAIRAQLREWLRRLHEQVPVTTVVVTHDQEEALELADQVVVINAGRVEQAGTPADLYDRPATPFVMRFVGESTVLDGSLHRPHDIDLVPDAGFAAAPGAADSVDGGSVEADGGSVDGGSADGGFGAVAGPVGTVTRVVPLPTHIRVDVDVPEHPEAVVVHLPRGGTDLSQLTRGRPVRLRARRARRFS